MVKTGGGNFVLYGFKLMDPSHLTDGQILTPPDAAWYYVQNQVNPATQTPCHVVWSGPTYLDTDNHGMNWTAGAPPPGFVMRIGTGFGPEAYPNAAWLGPFTSGNYFTIGGKTVSLDGNHTGTCSVTILDNPAGSVDWAQLLESAIVHYADLHAPVMSNPYYPKAAPLSGYPALSAALPAKNPGGPYIYGSYSIVSFWWLLPDVDACGNHHASHLVLAQTSPGDGYQKLTTAPTPVIDHLEPDHGPIAGGTAVVIVGSGFGDGATVTFDGVAATSVTVVDQYHITCTAPAHALGTASVRVTNLDGVQSAP